MVEDDVIFGVFLIKVLLAHHAKGLGEMQIL